VHAVGVKESGCIICTFFLDKLKSNFPDFKFQGKCRNLGKVCGYWAKECKKGKGNLHCGSTSESYRNFCGVKGHRGPRATRRIPRRLPTGGRTKNKTESALSSDHCVVLVRLELSDSSPGQEGLYLGNIAPRKCVDL